MKNCGRCASGSAKAKLNALNAEFGTPNSRSAAAGGPPSLRSVMPPACGFAWKKLRSSQPEGGKWGLQQAPLCPGKTDFGRAFEHDAM